ncbi:hypothetical protein acsn021_11680 [Anaerocolumna cellulosilytica]|uniref:Uncharacterized protein n=1 Tax=Anaerocolumna cellulosilytica TaxID=433286 RepID=A0A6S6QX23_9FIRM|nr:hypothetical protein [Anaerocolumna cellulosilytica]MBB5196097.1 hypothetical protein [Anaerocolumna cellulosilytica]BCJ93599.1 hypothetical protein acsn021_11680 [Anaerocolumna cellulosilytica]
MGKNISDYLFDAGSIMLNATKDVVRRHEDESVQEERNIGAGILAEALLEVNVKDDVIIRLVQKYYGLSEREAEELMISERTINMPCQELETFLVRSEGYTRDEAVDFIYKKDIPDFLRENKEYWKLSPGELLSKVKKEQ